MFVKNVLLSLVSSAPLALAAVIPAGDYAMDVYGCGEVSIFFTGLPGAHPLVWGQGYNGTLAQEGIEQDTANLVAAGYNMQVLLMGPEHNMSEFRQYVGDTTWTGVGLGFGVRGSSYENLTIRSEDILNFYHKQSPSAPIVFDHSYNTAEWSIKRHFPIFEDCTDKPGKLIAG